MSSVRSKGTKPELAVRRMLRRAGLRYRVHDRTLPGTPDVSNKRLRLAVFVDGCFWRGGPECYSEPKSNVDFWRAKVRRNKKRRENVRVDLKAMGFRVVGIWEHDAVDEPNIVMKLVSAALGAHPTRAIG